MSKYIEVEIRAELNKHEYENILRDFCNIKPYVQTNFYLDDSSLSFSNSEHGLRIREKDSKYELTLKRKTGNNFIEINQKITAKTKDILAKPGFFPDGEVKKYLIKNDLLNPINVFIVCSLKTERIDIEYNGTIISLDKNKYFDVTDYNIECESVTNSNVEKVLSEFLSKYKIKLKKSRYTKLQKALSKIK